MANEIREENLSLALRYIVDNFGKDTLLNANKVESILSDLIPRSSTDINWAVDAIKLGIMKILLDENNIDEQSQKQAIQRAEEFFKKQYVAELRMNYILDNLSYALGWNNTKVDNLKVYEANKNKKSSKKLQLKKEEKQSDNQKQNRNDQSKNDNLKYEEILKQPYTEIPQKQPIKKNTENNQDSRNKDPFKNVDNSKNNKPKQPNRYDNSNKSNKKFLWLLLIPLVLILGFLGSKLFFGVGDVTVSYFNFNSAYDLQGSTYIFDEDESVELNIKLDAKNPSKIDDSKVSYSVDDSGICNYTKEGANKCILIGMGEGTTTLRIYYDGKEIKSIGIGFGDIGESDAFVDQIHVSSNVEVQGSDYILPVNEKADIQVVLGGEDADYSELSYTIDDSSIASISGSGKICKIYGEQAGFTSLRILYDGEEIDSISLTFEEGETEEASTADSLDSNSEVDLTVKGYLENYSDAVNYGEVSYVAKYLTSTGAFYKELSKTIPKNYEKGTQVDVIGYTKNSMKQESGQYRVGMTIEYHVYKEGKTKYQKEYMEFIVVQQSGVWFIDRYENWKLLEQHEV